MSAIVGPRADGSVPRGGRDLRILLDCESADATLAVVDCRIPSGTAGPPLHRHPSPAETFLVTSGGFEQFHRAAAEAIGGRGRLSGAELGIIASGFDWQLVFPPRVLTPSGVLRPA